MSESPRVAAVRRQLEAYNAGDFEASTVGLDPDVEWIVAREHPASRTVRGLDELVDYHGDWQRTMPGLSIEVLEIDESGDSVLAICRLVGEGAESGAEVGVRIGFVSRFRNERIIRVEEYLDPDEARGALAAS
jgi:ketosteroid isomerase-like protein